jgi:hypothetical protein
MAKSRRNAKPAQEIPNEDERPMPPKRSAAQLEKMKKTAEWQIDEFLKKVGYVNPAERTDEDGWRWFDFGGVKGRAGITGSNEDMFLRAEAHAMDLPPDKDRMLKVLRDLMEANMNLAGPARLGIYGESVFVSSTMPFLKLTASAAQAHIQPVMEIAATLHEAYAEQAKKEGESQEQQRPPQTDGLTSDDGEHLHSIQTEESPSLPNSSNEDNPKV